MADVNYWAILAGVVIYYALGALWYSPLLFGKQWMAEVGLTEEKLNEAQQDAWKSYLTALVSAIIIAYTMARLGAYMDVKTLAGGLHLGFWSWFGFVLTTMATNSAFSGKSLKLLMIDSGYHLCGFLIIGILTGTWH